MRTEDGGTAGASLSQCKAALGGARAAGSRWAQVIDVEVIRKVTEWALPGLECRCCGTVTFAEPPPGAYAGSVLMPLAEVPRGAR